MLTTKSIVARLDAIILLLFMILIVQLNGRIESWAGSWAGYVEAFVAWVGGVAIFKFVHMVERDHAQAEKIIADSGR